MRHNIRTEYLGMELHAVINEGTEGEPDEVLVLSATWDGPTPEYLSECMANGEGPWLTYRPRKGGAVPQDVLDYLEEDITEHLYDTTR